MFFGILYLLSVSAATAKNVNDIIAKAEEKGMDLVGQIGNKVFFKASDKYSESNWMAGENMCQTAGLEYAKISNIEEYQIIYNNLPAATQYWVGASLKGIQSDSSNPSFAWTDGTEVSNVLHVRHLLDHWVCLFFAKDTRQFIITDSCTLGRHRPLCQITV